MRCRGRWACTVLGAGAAALLGAAPLGGCADRPSPGKAHDDGPPTQEIPKPNAVRQTSQGGFYVAINPSPDPVPLNQLFSVDVRVYQDEQLQKPASSATIKVDAGMPAHHHGMNLRPRISDMGNGAYRVTGMLFHMPGAWEMYVDVTDASVNRSERARFEMEVR